MALSGSFSAKQRNGKETVRCDWSGTQNVASNKTTITAKLYFTNQYAISIGSRTHTITINGKTQTITSGNITTAGKHYIGSVSVDVPHNSDGTKSISMSFVFSLKATLSGAYYESMSSSTTASLNTIPRASTPSLSASSVAMGSSVTINTNRASSSFTHTLTYAFGSISDTIASSVKDSTTWKPALSLASQIPKATSETATITCKTYNGSTLIGTTTETITLTVPSSVVPSISSITVTDFMDYLSTYDGYVQNKSKAKIVVSASGSYSSTITAYKITANGATYTSNSPTTEPLKTSGTNTISVTVTDSRGRTATKSTTILVLAYTSPTISSLKAIRCDSSGNADENGSYMKVTVSASITALNDKNNKTFNLQYKKDNETAYTTYQTYTSDYEYNSTAIISIGTDYIYNVNVIAIDSFGSCSYQVDVGTAYTLLDFNASGKGVAFGKVSTEDGFDVNMPTLFRQGVKTEQGNELDSKYQVGYANYSGITKEVVATSLSSAFATYTAPSTGGFAIVEAEATFPSGTYRKFVDVYKNGARISRQESAYTSTGNTNIISVSAICDLNENDNITAKVYNGSSSSKSITNCQMRVLRFFKY